MEAQLDGYSDAPLTPLENKKMRRMLESDERAHWFWTASRFWLSTVATGIAITVLIANGGLDLIKKLFMVK